MNEKYFTPTVNFSIRELNFTVLDLDIPGHLRFDEPFYRWLTNICPNKKTGCWNWYGYVDKDGYGKFCYNTKGTRIDARAHRFGYEKLIGPIPDGLVTDHLCRVRDCVNPWHLEPVTQIENVRRGLVSEVTTRRNAAITHCPQGHEYSGWNLMRYGKRRFCRKCLYRSNRRRKETMRVQRIANAIRTA